MNTRDMPTMAAERLQDSRVFGYEADHAVNGEKRRERTLGKQMSDRHGRRQACVIRVEIELTNDKQVTIKELTGQSRALGLNTQGCENSASRKNDEKKQLSEALHGWVSHKQDISRSQDREDKRKAHHVIQKGTAPKKSRQQGMSGTRADQPPTTDNRLVVGLEKRSTHDLSTVTTLLVKEV